MNPQEYEALISDRNSRRVKFMGFVEAVLNAASGNASAVESLDMAFAIDNAAGAQLDILGDLVGIKRLLDYEPSVGGREMDDDEYRICIKMCVAMNKWDGTNEGALSAYSVLSASGLNINYFDNQDLTVKLIIVDDLSVRMYEILQSAGLLLVPAGVGVEFEFSGSSSDVPVYAAAAVCGIEEVVDVPAISDGGE